MNQEQTSKIFQCMAAVLKENGLRAELLQGQEPGQPLLLRIEYPRAGKVMQDIMIEMCFIPMHQLPSEGIGLLQYYATLFTGLRSEHMAEVKRCCTYCNDYCALGAFGYFEPAGQLYLRHNTIVPIEGEIEKIVSLLADNLSLVIASVTRFIDAFAAISNGVMTVQTAIQQELLPSMN